jgi:hypothetical protein
MAKVIMEIEGDDEQIVDCVQRFAHDMHYNPETGTGHPYITDVTAKHEDGSIVWPIPEAADDEDDKE